MSEIEIESTKPVYYYDLKGKKVREGKVVVFTSGVKHYYNHAGRIQTFFNANAKDTVEEAITSALSGQEKLRNKYEKNAKDCVNQIEYLKVIQGELCESAKHV